MNRYMRILIAVTALFFGALVTGSGLFGAASNPDNTLSGILVAAFGAVTVAAGIWLGVGGSDVGGPNVDGSIGGGGSAGRAGHLVLAAVTGVLALISLGYFFTGLGDSRRPEQDGGFGFMPIGLVGMVLFGSASVLCLIAWLGAKRR